MSTNFDPMAGGYSKPEFDTNLFGKMEVTAVRQYKPEGEKMREWQPGDPDTARKTVKFTFALTTIDAMNLTRPVQQRNTLNFTDDWNNIIWPSIESLGCNTLRDVNEKFVEVEVVPNGRKYTNKEGKEREETTFRFLRIFPTEADCIRAYEDAAGVSHEASEAVDETALTVARALISTSKGDLKKLAANLKAAGSPFTVESEIIVSLLKEAAVPA